MLTIPPRPAEPNAPSARASVPLRFEDITQDGHLQLDGMASAFGAVGREMLRSAGGSRGFIKAGIVPIFTRIAYETGGGPFSTKGPIEAEGTFQLARAVNPQGETERLVIHVWIDGTLPLGRNFGVVEGAGTPALAGRIFMEQTFTRLFAGPGDRKVLRFDIPGQPEVPEAKTAFVPPASLLDVAGLHDEVGVEATLLDPELVHDAAPLLFGVNDTDSNLHVNSLVYPRLFESAALRRLDAHDRGGRGRGGLLARFVDVTFRKPCFAGERYVIALRAFELSEGARKRSGALGVFLSEAEAKKPFAEARPNAYARILFD